MPDYKVTRITEQSSLVNGKPGAQLVVEFTVGDDGPFVERFDKSAFTAELLRDRLTSFAQTLQRART